MFSTLLDHRVAVSKTSYSLRTAGFAAGCDIDHNRHGYARVVAGKVCPFEKRYVQS